MMMKFIFFILGYMFSVGFFMYFERKFLGVCQYREGPNKVIIKGYLQFINDMFKLFIKMILDIYNYKFMFYYLIPFIMLINVFLMWLLYPLNSGVMNLEISMIYLLVLMVMKMLYLVFMVFFVYSIYSFMSMMRMIIQLISYDVIVILVLVFNFILYSEFNMLMYLFNYLSVIIIVNLYIFFFWFMSLMVELIRLPFDFYEGESELVSGFNIEYSSFLFLFLVLFEYMEMIYFMMITILIFIFNNLFSFYFSVLLLFFVFMVIWMRVFFVRYRLDKMLMVLWKFIFPLIMFIVFLYYFVNLL